MTGTRRSITVGVAALTLALSSAPLLAADSASAGFHLGSIPLEFLLFGLTLLGVAVFHQHTFGVAVSGFAAIAAYKTAVTGFAAGSGLSGLAAHLAGESVTLANLFLLLLGFALLARHFERSGIPDALPARLPHSAVGAFALLVIVFVLSAFLDNIAAALIGGTIARHLFDNKVHTGYVAALVAASNAGGAGSVVGDTTTTMMWIAGVSPLEVFRAYVAAVAALIACGIPAALQQHRFSPIRARPAPDTPLDWTRLVIVAAILLAAIGANIVGSTWAPWLAARVPLIGLAVWATLLLAAPIRRPDWHLARENLAGAVFLLALVAAASMMPVQHLAKPSWLTTLGLGAVSALFDNIPLTALALRQGGYDWGFLAYAVGFGGSLLWFGSSAGVAIAGLYPESRNALRWATAGWHVALAYLVGFWVILAILGWHPTPLNPH